MDRRNSRRGPVIITDRGSVFVDDSGAADTPTPRCDEDIPFEPTYLPNGFDHELFEGRLPGGRPPDDQSSIGGERGEAQAIVHYRGSGGRTIEIRRPGTAFTELAQRSDTPKIEVLGTETTGFAPIQPRGNKFIVQFSYPATAGPRQWCSLYYLNEYGVKLAELKEVAEGLRARSKEEPFRLPIPLRCSSGLSKAIQLLLN